MPVMLLLQLGEASERPGHRAGSGRVTARARSTAQVADQRRAESSTGQWAIKGSSRKAQTWPGVGAPIKSRSSTEAARRRVG